MYKQSKLGLVVLALTILMVPLFVRAAVSKGEALLKTEGLSIFSEREMVSKNMVVDGNANVVEGTIRFTTEDGETTALIRGNIDKATGEMVATFSGADDYNFATDKSDRHSHYLRTVFDGNLRGTMQERGLGGAYVWTGYADINYIVVLSKKYESEKPSKNDSFIGAFELEISPERVVGIDTKSDALLFDEANAAPVLKPGMPGLILTETDPQAQDGDQGDLENIEVPGNEDKTSISTSSVPERGEDKTKDDSNITLIFTIIAALILILLVIMTMRPGKVS